MIFRPMPWPAGPKGPEAIEDFIARKLDQYGLAEPQLAIVGFSQGTMMALQVGLRRDRQVACIVGYSGMLVGAATLPETLAAKPPVLLIHGSADQVVPVAAMHDADRHLRARDIEVTTHESQGLGHSVDQDGLQKGGAFIAKSFASAQ